jgi:hypothetical protein
MRWGLTTATRADHAQLTVEVGAHKLTVVGQREVVPRVRGGELACRVGHGAIVAVAHGLARDPASGADRDGPRTARVAIVDERDLVAVGVTDPDNIGEVGEDALGHGVGGIAVPEQHAEADALVAGWGSSVRSTST